MITHPASGHLGGVIILDDDNAHLLDGRSWCSVRWNPPRGTLYASGTINGQRTYLHHAVAGKPLSPQHVVDHINGNGLDNRRENLRHITKADNARNRQFPFGRCCVIRPNGQQCNIAAPEVGAMCNVHRHLRGIK